MSLNENFSSFDSDMEVEMVTELTPVTLTLRMIDEMTPSMLVVAPFQ